MARKGKQGTKLTALEKQKLASLGPKYVQRELTLNDIANVMGRSKASMWSYLKKMGFTIKQVNSNAMPQEEPDPEPIKYDDLEPAAKAAWDDFKTFFETYVGPTLDGYTGMADYQLELVGWLDSGVHKRLVINMAPGHGKSFTLLSYILWRIVRDRNIRVVYITGSQELAKDAVSWLQGQMTENEKLVKAFGRFKPDVGLWQRGKFHVQGASQITAKAATVAAYGRGARVLGTRPSIILADDVVDEKMANNQMEMDRVQDWWHKIVERRLEVWKSQATLAVVGQRIAPGDLYAHLVTLMDDNDRPIYDHFVLPAHDETRCPGDGTHPAQPAGCTLWPEKWPYEELMIARAQMNAGDKGLFELVFQQQDIPQSDVLVPRSWIYGGKDPIDGGDVPGCLDQSRSQGQVPSNIHGLISVVTIDPSHTGFWAVQWWLYEADTALGTLPTWHLYRMLRQRMKGEAEMLDFTPAPKGILEQWYTESLKKGIPLKYLIVERNLIRSSSFLQGYQQTQWAQGRGIRVLQHETEAANKHGEQGVWSLRARFLPGKVRIPYADPETRVAMEPFINELTHYTNPQTYKTDDTVMAAWFLLWNESRIARKPIMTGFDARPVPEYAKRMRFLLDPMTQRRTPA